jgi:molybdopterin synthase sulfurtransferase
MATTKDLLDIVSGTNASSIIVDDRAWDEYTGATNSYYWWFDEKGRIPTAKWIGDWTDISSSDAQSFMPFAEAKYKWTQSGFSPDKKMNFYCGGGARSAMYTFYAYMMGWPAANYEGGWYLWSTDHNNARETGIPK